MEICKHFKKTKTLTVKITKKKNIFYYLEGNPEINKNKTNLSTKKKKNIKSNFFEIVLCISKKFSIKYYQAKKRHLLKYQIKKFRAFLMTKKGFFEKKVHLCKTNRVFTTLRIKKKKYVNVPRTYIIYNYINFKI